MYLINKHKYFIHFTIKSFRFGRKDFICFKLNYLEVLFELFEEREPQRLDDFALSLVVLELPQLEQFSAVFVSLAFLFLPNIFHLLKFCKFCLLI